MTILGTIQEFVILAIAFVIRVANLGGPLLSSYAWMGRENSHPTWHPFPAGKLYPSWYTECTSSMVLAFLRSM